MTAGESSGLYQQQVAKFKDIFMDYTSALAEALRKVAATPARKRLVQREFPRIPHHRVVDIGTRTYSEGCEVSYRWGKVEGPLRTGAHIRSRLSKRRHRDEH